MNLKSWITPCAKNSSCRGKIAHTEELQLLTPSSTLFSSHFQEAAFPHTSLIGLWEIIYCALIYYILHYEQSRDFMIKHSDCVKMIKDAVVLFGRTLSMGLAFLSEFKVVIEILSETPFLLVPGGSKGQVILTCHDKRLRSTQSTSITDHPWERDVPAEDQRAPLVDACCYWADSM